MQITVREPGSALTHFIGRMMAMFASTPLLIKASRQPEKIHIVVLSIFIVSMIFLYAASTIYHTLDLSEKVNIRLKKIDHMMIFILIAGTYTPICMIALPQPIGICLLSLVWAIAIVGIIVKMFWIMCPKWFSSMLYIGMGWVCVLAFTQLLNSLPTAAFLWLLAGGIIYTIGGVIYALKLPIFNAKHKYFGSHEVFHVFVMGGSICHFIVMYAFIAGMPVK